MMQGKASIAKGAFITISMRWIDRVIGFASTLILARLLLPEDFGIIAMASLVIGLVDVLFDLGVNVALIQNPKANHEHYNTAWTLRILQTILAAGVIVLGAPFAGDYFGDQRVVPVIQFMAIGLVVNGLENIGVVSFQKNMQFGRDFRFLFSKRITGFIVTVVAALTMQTYWALVIGALTGRVMGVVLSYWMHPMRPRLSLTKFNEIFAVSQWMLVRSVGAYLDNNLHRMFVGRVSGTGTMGAYTLADEISAMPTSELLAPINRVLFPAFAQARENPAELKRLLLLAQGVQTLVGVPAAIGLALVAHEAISILLGAKWLIAVPFVQFLALTHAAEAITTSTGYAMITVGQARRSALLVWAKVIIFCATIFVLMPSVDAIQIAQARLATSVTAVILALWLVLHAIENLKIRDILATIARPLFGAMAMSTALLLVFDGTTLPLSYALTGKISLGFIVYSTTVLLIWLAQGKPAGAESYALEKTGFLIKKILEKYS